MPYCPECKYEYVEGTTTCPDCDVELAPSLPGQIDAGPFTELLNASTVYNKCPDEPELVEVFSSGNRQEIDIVRSVLESEGIPSIVKSDLSTMPEFFTLSLSTIRPVRILVPEPLAEKAVQLIEEVQRAGESIPSDDLGISTTEYENIDS